MPGKKRGCSSKSADPEIIMQHFYSPHTKNGVFMRHVQITGTELSVSPICLGTVEFGADIPETQAFALLDAFVAASGNFIDSALVYSDWHPGPRGSAEKTIGRWLKARGKRDQIVL